MKSFFLFSCLFLLGALLFTPAQSYADDSCALGVMLIEGKKKENNFTSSLNKGSNKDAIPLPVKHQLATLPFADFELLQKRKEPSNLGKKTHFSLRDNNGQIHQLDITPIKVVSQKVHALLCWRGPSNSTLLKTKLWIKNGQSMVVGAEMENQDSLILNVSIDCQL